MKEYTITDFHSHILPGADHGSDGMKTSSAQLKIISDAKTQRVVATPHFYPSRHRTADFIERRNTCAARLAAAMPNGSPEVLVGAEVLVCEGLEDMEMLESLCIDGTRTILLEMPMMAWNRRLFDTVEAIKKRGLEVVMAHIDRYPDEDVDALLELGVPAQLNASSLCSVFERKPLLRRVRNGVVVALGSDLHGADRKAYARFVKACSVLGDFLEPIMDATDRLLVGAKKLG